MLGNKYVAAAVGIMVLLVIAYNVQFFMSKNRTAVAPELPSQTEKKKPAPAAKYSAQAPVTGIDSSGNETKGPWKRDPFSLKSGTDKTVLTEKIRLTGIIKGERAAHALINGKAYSVNDRIGNAVIREIRQHSIVIQSDSIKQEITFDDYKVLKERSK